MSVTLAITRTSLALHSSRWLCCTAPLTHHVDLGVPKAQTQPLPLHQLSLWRPLTSSPFLLGSEEEGAPHFRRSSVKHPLADQISTASSPTENKSYSLPHPIWSDEEVNSVRITHTPPTDRVDKAAYYAIRLLRLMFDVFSGYSWGKWMGSLNEKKWLTRFIFLETVAGVPGMIGAMTRHLKSLRYMQRDHGWIHTLLEEAENERMHLLTFLELRKPGPLFKAMVAMDEGELPMWSGLPAPLIAVKYWKLGENAMMRDVILAIRADEAHHRVVNHTLSSIKPLDDNPYGPGR